MELKEMISRRKSTRSYTHEPVDEKTIEKMLAFAQTMKPLIPGIRVRAEIGRREDVKCICPWTTPQVLALYSEKKEGFLENVGFLYQQMDLYLHTLGLGACWLGMGRPQQDGSLAVQTPDGLSYVIMLAFGYPKGTLLRTGAAQFKRRALSAISDREDERLNPARLAPSAANSQPWYFVHHGDTIRAYCAIKGLFRAEPSDMNRIDMGIALSHLYVSHMDTFAFFKEQHAPAVKGYAYTGSFTL